MPLSIIIPYHNEGQGFIEQTISEIRSTIDVHPYEIIVVNDCSDQPLNPIEDTIIINHTNNLGVGAAFDTGVSYASYDNLWIMGCDIRFRDNHWASTMVSEIEAHPQAITCTSLAMLNETDYSFDNRVNYCVGATILMYHDPLTNKAAHKNFKGIIEAKWLPLTRDINKDSYPIPCVLGAAYGLKKAWYEHIDGFWGHKLWGTLEPLISIKSWLFGGECRVAPRCMVGHIFKKKGTHGTPQRHLMYNKMLTSTLLVPNYQVFIDYLGDNAIVRNGKAMYDADIKKIMAKREEYAAKTTYSLADLCKRFEIDMRGDRQRLIDASVVGDSPVVLLYPDKLRGNRLKFALDNMGITYHNDPQQPYDVGLYWSYHQVARHHDELSKTLLNGGCSDISKSKINKVFPNIAVDPETYQGTVVAKMEHQGSHSGKLVLCPTVPVKGWVYQKFIDSHEADGYVVYRVFYSGQVDFVVKQWEKDMFRLSHGRLDFVEKTELMTPEQELWLVNGLKEFGCDFGEVDVMKDSDGEIYVVDINNVAGNAPEMWSLVKDKYIESVKQFILKNKKK